MRPGRYSTSCFFSPLSAREVTKDLVACENCFNELQRLRRVTTHPRLQSTSAGEITGRGRKLNTFTAAHYRLSRWEKAYICHYLVALDEYYCLILLVLVIVYSFEKKRDAENPIAQIGSDLKITPTWILKCTIYNLIVYILTQFSVLLDISSILYFCFITFCYVLFLFLLLLFFCYVYSKDRDKREYFRKIQSNVNDCYSDRLFS